MSLCSTFGGNEERFEVGASPGGREPDIRLLWDQAQGHSARCLNLNAVGSLEHSRINIKID